MIRPEFRPGILPDPREEVLVGAILRMKTDSFSPKVRLCFDQLSGYLQANLFPETVRSRAAQVSLVSASQDPRSALARDSETQYRAVGPVADI